MGNMHSLTAGDGWFAVIELNRSSTSLQTRFLYAEVVVWGVDDTEGVIGLIWNGKMQLEAPNSDGHAFRAYVRGEEQARTYAEQLELEMRAQGQS